MTYITPNQGPAQPYSAPPAPQSQCCPTCGRPPVAAPQRDRGVWMDVMMDTRDLGLPSELMRDSELEAVKRAGRDAGGYLVEIGKTDMAQLSVEEWRRFCILLILGYEVFQSGFKHNLTA